MSQEKPMFRNAKTRIGKTLMLAVALACAGAAVAQAGDPAAAPAMTAEQQAMMEAYEKMGEVRAEHKALEYFVGTWNVKTQMWMDPSAPPEQGTGKAVYTLKHGGRYLELVQTGEAMGQAFQGNGLTGYDNLKGHYFSSWYDSMSTGLFVATGTYDAASKTWSFSGETPDPMKPGTHTKIRVVEKIADSDHYTFEYYETHDGKEAKTMQMDFTRA